MDKCDERFSLCLDCDLHNHCKRYCNHRDEAEKKGEGNGIL